MLIIQGAGDLATGVAHRLYKAGYKLLMVDLEKPTVIRRSVAFAQAIYVGECVVEAVKAKKANLHNWKDILNSKMIPVLSANKLSEIEKLPHQAFIEATISKKNMGIRKKEERVTIALGPGYEAGIDVDVVIETKRGHYLGSVIYNGKAIANTGIPGDIAGFSKERLIKSPIAGVVIFTAKIGDIVKKGQIIAKVNEFEIEAKINGILRGALKNGLTVTENFKIGDIDPRANVEYVHTISDKARSVAGGVLEALLCFKILP